MRKTFNVGILFFLIMLSGSWVEARLRYQEKSPFTCDTCHIRKEITDTGLYFYLNNFKMTGHKPLKTEDSALLEIEDLRLSAKIATLAEKKKKNALTIQYMNKVLAKSARWKGDPLPEFKTMELLNLKMEKDVIKLLKTAEEGYTKGGKGTDAAIRLYAQLEHEYKGIKILKEPLATAKYSIRSDPDQKKKYDAFRKEFQNNDLVNEVNELINLKCYLSAKEKLVALKKYSDADIQKKVILIEQKLQEGDIPQLIAEEELSEVAYKDFQYIEEYLKRGIKTKGDRRSVLTSLRDMINKYRNTIHETRATEIYEKIIAGEYDGTPGGDDDDDDDD